MSKPAYGANKNRRRTSSLRARYLDRKDGSSPLPTRRPRPPEKARRAHLTLAERVRVRIVGRRTREAAERDSLAYPPGWFERTCGSLVGAEIERVKVNE